MVEIINVRPPVGGGDVFLANTQEFTGVNTFDLQIRLGISSSLTGILRFLDANSTNVYTITLPAGGISGTRSLVLSDVAGSTFVAGDGADPATVAGTMSKVQRPGQVANIASQTLIKTCPAGMYTVLAYLECTTPGTGTPTLNFTYTDDGGAITKAILALSMTTAKVATNVAYPLYLASGDLTWTVTGYTSGTYALRMRAVSSGA